MARRAFLIMAFCAVALLGVTVAFAKPSTSDAGAIIRVGHFPNLLHAQALVARAMGRNGNGWFESRLGEALGRPVKLEWFTYNAGPSAMEALLTRNIDFSYVGPNPAVNAFVRSGSVGVSVVSAAAYGGAALVVHPDLAKAKPEDFRGKKLASPQLGNTQDVALRSWLIQNGFNVTQTGGDVTVVPVANPDQLTLMQRGDIDGAWTVEPWASRLEIDAGAVPYLEDKESLAAVLTVSSEYGQANSATVAAFVKAHEALTDWIAANPAEAKQLMLAQLKAETGREMAETLFDRAWARIKLSHVITEQAFDGPFADAVRLGYLPKSSSIAGLLRIRLGAGQW